MKTILHIIDTTGPGGAESVFINLADKSRLHGYSSIALIRGPGWVNDELLKRGVPTRILESRGRFNLGFLLQLIKLIRSENIVLIHAHLLGAAVYSAMAGWLTRTPVIATFHGMVDVSPNERFRKLKLWIMDRAIYKYVTVSQGLMRVIASENLLQPSKTTVIYNGIPSHRYSGDKSDELRSSLDINEDSIIAGCLGNVRPAKGYDVLIEAMSILKDEYPRLKIVVAGHKKPELMDKLDVLIKEKNLTDDIFFIGYQDNSASFLKGLDLFLLPSTSEGFSISTIEAMACGLPMVVTRCGGPEEIVEHEVTGIMVEPGNAEDFSAGIKRLLSDTTLSQRLAQSGPAAVNKKFSEELMLQSYKELYESAKY